MAANQEVIDDFWRAIHAGKDVPSVKRQVAADDIRQCYDRVRVALDDVVPPDIRRTADLTLANLESCGLSSISRSSCHRSTTSSRRARQEAEIAALELEREHLATKVKKLAGIRELQAEEEARKAEFEATEVTRRAQEEARKAQMEAERARHVAEEKRRQIEARKEIERLRSEVKQEKLRLDIEKKRIKLEAYDDDLADLDEFSDTDDEASEHEEDKAEEDKAEEDKAAEDKAAEDHASNPPASEDECLPHQALISALGKLSLSRLPIPEPPTFYGDTLEYPAWKAALSTLIEGHGVPALERFHYLKRYLGGEAKAAIEGLFFLGTDKAYAEGRRILEERYGDPFLVSEAFRKKLDGWPRIKGHKDLLLFSDFLEQVKVAQGEMCELKILDDCHENRNLLKKLPVWLVRKWNVIIYNHSQSGYPKFADFARFIQTEARISNNHVTAGLGEEVARDKKGPRKEVKCRATSTTTTRRNSDRQGQAPQKVQKQDRPQTSDVCLCCKNPKHRHELSKCHFFKGYDMDKRVEFIRNHNLCFGCLGSGHRSKYCGQRATCGECGKKHPTLLHKDITEKPEPEPKEPEGEKVKEPASSDTHSAVSHRVQKSADSTSMIVPVVVSVAESESETLTYAIIDTQSDASFISESLADTLGGKMTPVQLSIKTMTSPNSSTKPARLLRNLTVHGMGLDKRITIDRVYTSQHIPAERSQIPTKQTAEAWPHLQHLATSLQGLQDFDVDLLIGTNCPPAGIPREVVVHNDHVPYAVRTDLGWSIISGSGATLLCNKVCNKVSTKEHPDVQNLLNVLQQDFNDTKEGHPGDSVYSQDDLKFVKQMKGSIKQCEDGHLEMALPFKERPKLPNNRKLADVRLQHLQRKMTQDKMYKEQYTEFMEDIIASGYAEKAPDADVEPSTLNYIPHHGVFHPTKKKIRVVFDCSARFAGTCLNDHLLKGPDLNNGLVGVLVRFRREEVALICDIQKMFYQFRVPSEDRDYLRFLWWENGDLTKEPVDYRMSVHLFGAASSPACANYGLKHLADMHKEDLPIAAGFINKDFYVDDGVTSVPNTETGIKLAAEARELCAKGGLRLHKFMSNDRKVVESIPTLERATEVTDLDLEFDQLPLERTLGICWCVETDTFRFNITLKHKPETRRGILSTVCSVFDPLGLISPLVLTGRQILQELCRMKLGWDDPISDELQVRWDSWQQEMLNLDGMSIDRCYKPKNFGDVVTVEMHHFADASTTGYGACSYLRQVNTSGHVHSALVMSKARVTPTKVMTMPRLELSAALLAVRVSSFLGEEMQYPCDMKHTFYSDSQVVLGYISNDARRFHTFVANRVQQIRDRTEPSQWKYICTEDNPADHASRGTSVAELMSSNWFHGPAFLRETSPEPLSIEPELEPGDPEVRATTLTTNTEGGFSIVSRIEKFSDWTTAVRAVALLQRVARREVCGRRPVTPEETLRAEQFILMSTQREAYPEDLDRLGQKLPVRTNSQLHSLNPTLDQNGLLRVGGRLAKASFEDAVKHPVILPKEGHVTRLVIRHIHESTRHQGRGITLNEIRQQGYWIIGGSKPVQGYIRNCVVCRKGRRPPEEQKMADLPEDRLESTPPFVYVGMDCFGPFVIKKGRSEVKRYGLLFTCLCSRAIHIEMLEDMSTDSFINGLRRFIAIRGAVRLLRSDQGSNFVGARNELKEALKELDLERVETYLSNHQCEFLMNAPASSHAGGVWERQIRTVRSVLEATLRMYPGRLDDSCLRTYLYEAMSIVNGRPLSVSQLGDPLSPEPLTPNHLVQMKSEVALPPPGVFVKEDIYLRKRWRRVQHLCEVFWGRWRKEYLLSLNERQKWNTPRRNLKEGDIVMIIDQTAPRMQWPLAMVVEAIPADDGLVRRVRVAAGTQKLDKHGRRSGELSTYERPIQKVVLLKESENPE